MKHLFISFLLITSSAFSAGIDRSTPQQRAFRETIREEVDTFVRQAFNEAEDTKKNGEKDDMIAAFNEEIESLKDRGFKKYNHYSVYFENLKDWHDDVPNFDVTKFTDLQTVYEKDGALAKAKDKMSILNQTEGKIHVVASFSKDINGSWYYTAEVKLIVRYYRYPQGKNGAIEQYVVPQIVQTTFKRETTLEGNGSSAGGPR